MHKGDSFIHFVNRTNEWVGKIVSLCILLIMAIAMLEVLLRYFFDRPTIWAWEVNGQLFAAICLLGAGYTLLHNDHIRMDVLYHNLSFRNKALADTVTSSLFLFFVGILLWQGADMALTSLKIREVSASFFAPPLYYVKLCLPIGAFLLLLQGLSRLLCDIRTIITGKEQK